MKTIFRFLSLAVLVAGFTVAGGTSIFAQDPPATPAPAGPCDNTEARTALEQKVRDNYSKDKPVAIAAGDEYIKTYGSCTAEDIQAFVKYLNGYLPGARDSVKKAEDAKKRKETFDRFNNSFKANPPNFDESYRAGKEILGLSPADADNLDIILVLGSIGFDELVKKNNKYNDDTIRFAKLAIQKLNEGKTSGTGLYGGVGGIAYKNEKFPNGKDNALGWMNYTIGYIMAIGQGNKKDAMPYLYKASQQANSGTQRLAQLYGIIGDYYFDEVKRLGAEFKVKTEAAGNKDTDETRALTAQLKGYAERAIDAYGRAQSLVSATDPAVKAYREGLAAQIDLIYNLRFDKTTGVKEFVAASIAKPFPDPTTVPAPIVETEPVAAPTTTGSAPTTTPGAKPGTPPATNGTKPATTPVTNGTKPASTAPSGTKKPVSVNGASTPSGSSSAAAKPVVKKPVVKKKGTR